MNEHGLKSVFCFLSATQDILSASRVSHLWRRVAIESGVFPYVPCCFLPAPWWSSRLNSVISSGERCDSDCGSDNDNGAKSAHVCCYSLAGLDDDSKREWYFGRQHAGLTVLRGLGLNELIPEQMRPFRILSIGLANAGKTVGTRLLKFHKILRTTYPTYDLLVEPLTWNYEGHNFKLEIWEIPGSDGESTWRHYASQCQGIMFTVDSSDFSSLKSAKWALHANFAESPKVLPLLVFASKQDIPDCLTTQEMAVAMGMHAIRCSAWRVQGYSKTVDTLMLQDMTPGVSWLLRQMIATHLNPEWGSVNRV